MGTLNTPAADEAGGQLLYLAENLATLHASADMAWLAGRFEFLGEKALGASLSILALPDETGAFRAVASASARPARITDIWRELHVDGLPDNATAAAAFAAAERQASAVTVELSEVFPPHESVAGVGHAVIAPVAFNRELIGVGLFIAPPSDRTSQMATVLANHTAVAIDQLRRREEAGRLHSVDERLWIPDEHFLTSQLRREVTRARRYGRHVGLAVLRLVNEDEMRAQFGDFFTDHLLRRIGSQLLADVRDSDILGAIDGAYGVIHTETPLAGTELSAERLRDSVARMVKQRFPEAPDADIGVSVAAFPATADSAESLLAAVKEPPLRSLLVA